MDEIRNPFAPGAGAFPHELVGRDEVIADVRVALERCRRGRHARHHVLTGLRGVGKTVLLDHLYREAITAKITCLKIEAPENDPLPALLVPELRKALLQLDKLVQAGDALRRGTDALRNFAAVFKVRYGEFEASVTPAERGLADSGHLETDLKDLLALVGEAARERDTVLAIFLDEIQYLSADDLGAFLAALHHAAQMRLPIMLVGAGLPQVTALLGEAKSYSERLIRILPIGPLSTSEAMKALTGPVEDEGESWDEAALLKIAQLTEGYPYFLQEWGYRCWDVASASPISLADVDRATPIVLDELDRSFFRVRLDRLSPKERDYLRAMASLPESRDMLSSEVAEAMGGSTQSLAKARDSLIKKGMIYSNAYGKIAFTVPLFGDFMRRAVPTEDTSR